jgi:hypothetical protein
MQLTHHLVLEVGAMINDNILQDTESSYDVVKKKECCSTTIVKKCRHNLNQFSELINDKNDINVPLG